MNGKNSTEQIKVYLTKSNIDYLKSFEDLSISKILNIIIQNHKDGNKLLKTT